MLKFRAYLRSVCAIFSITFGLYMVLGIIRMVSWDNDLTFLNLLKDSLQFAAIMTCILGAISLLFINKLDNSKYFD